MVDRTYNRIHQGYVEIFINSFFRDKTYTHEELCLAARQYHNAVQFITDNMFNDTICVGKIFEHILDNPTHSLWWDIEPMIISEEYYDIKVHEITKWCPPQTTIATFHFIIRHGKKVYEYLEANPR